MKRTTFYTHAIAEARTTLHQNHGVTLEDLAEDFDRIHALAGEVGAHEDRVLCHGPAVAAYELRGMQKAARFLFLALTGLAVEVPGCYSRSDADKEAMAAVFTDLLDASADSCQAFTDAQNDTVTVGA
jgi:hypothetical protein